MEEQRRRFSVPRGYASVAQMLEAEDLDILDICAPREAHAALVREATRRGMAALCQKPLAGGLDEAEALVAELDPSARVMVHDNWRFRAPYRQIKALLEAGEAGTLRRVELDYLSSGMIQD